MWDTQSGKDPVLESAGGSLCPPWIALFIMVTSHTPSGPVPLCWSPGERCFSPRPSLSRAWGLRRGAFTGVRGLLSGSEWHGKSGGGQVNKDNLEGSSPCTCQDVSCLDGQNAERLAESSK